MTVLDSFKSAIKQGVAGIYTMYNSAIDDRFVDRVRKQLVEHNISDIKISQITRSLKKNLELLAFERDAELKNYRALYLALHDHLYSDLCNIEVGLEKKTYITRNFEDYVENPSLPKQEVELNVLYKVKHYGSLEKYEQLKLKHPLFLYDMKLIGYIFPLKNRRIYKILFNGERIRIKNHPQLMQILMHSMNVRTYPYNYRETLNFNDLSTLILLVNDCNMNEILQYAKEKKISIPDNFDHKIIEQVLKKLKNILSSLTKKECVMCEVEENRIQKAAYGCGVPVEVFRESVRTMKQYLQNTREMLDTNLNKK